MSAKPVQISIDRALLEQVDADPETRARGRSAFVRTAIEHYLAHKRQRQIEGEIARAYGGHADPMLDEVIDTIGAQAWPDE